MPDDELPAIYARVTCPKQALLTWRTHVWALGMLAAYLAGIAAFLLVFGLFALVLVLTSEFGWVSETVATVLATVFVCIEIGFWQILHLRLLRRFAAGRLVTEFSDPWRPEPRLAKKQEKPGDAVAFLLSAWLWLTWLGAGLSGNLPREIIAAGVPVLALLTIYIACLAYIVPRLKQRPGELVFRRP